MNAQLIEDLEQSIQLIQPIQSIQLKCICLKNLNLTTLDNWIEQTKWNNCTEFDCSFNELIQIDNLPQTITKLNCSSNNIVYLNNLPNGLVWLDCSNNLIVQLDWLPNSLSYLICRINKITNLDNLPIELILLDCSQNEIENLNNLPTQLAKLNCSNNKIANLNNLADSNIIEIDCSFNSITAIQLPNTIKIANIAFNPLKSRPRCNKTFYWLSTFFSISNMILFDKIILCFYEIFYFIKGISMTILYIFIIMITYLLLDKCV